MYSLILHAVCAGVGGWCRYIPIVSLSSTTGPKQDTWHDLIIVKRTLPPANIYLCSQSHRTNYYPCVWMKIIHWVAIIKTMCVCVVMWARCFVVVVARVNINSIIARSKNTYNFRYVQRDIVHYITFMFFNQCWWILVSRGVCVCSPHLQSAPAGWLFWARAELHLFALRLCVVGLLLGCFRCGGGGTRLSICGNKRVVS